MSTKTFQKLLTFFAFALGVECNATPTLGTIPGDGYEPVESSTSHRYGQIPDKGRQSLEYLRSHVSAQHLDENHPAVQALLATAPAPLPTSVDLTLGYPAPFDQGQLGACTAHALVGATLFELIKQGMASPSNCTGTNPTTGRTGSQMLSRLFVYYNERSIEGTVSQDAGASLSDGITVLHTQGVCLESLWPYSDNTASRHPLFAQRPPKTCYNQAKSCEEANIVNGASATPDLNPRDTASVAQQLSVIKTVLNAQCPIVCGIQVYSSFESDAVAANGIVPMPTAADTFLGGHAVAFAGYDDSKQAFLMRNSWGTDWGTSGKTGVRGYFWLPYAYATASDRQGNLYMSDLWKVGSIT